MSDAFIAELNSLLKQHPVRNRIATERGKNWTSKPLSRQTEPNDIWAPIAIAVAELLSDLSPVRFAQM